MPSSTWRDGHELTPLMKERIIVILAQEGDMTAMPGDENSLIPEGSLAAKFLIDYWGIKKTLKELLDEHGKEELPLPEGVMKCQV